jgi:hypothetical protein
MYVFDNEIDQLDNLSAQKIFPLPAKTGEHLGREATVDLPDGFKTIQTVNRRE